MESVARRVKQQSWKQCLWPAIKHCHYCTSSDAEVSTQSTQKCTTDSQEPGECARTKITWCWSLKTAFISISVAVSSAACLGNLQSHWVVAVPYQLSGDQEGNTSLCCKRRCNYSTDKQYHGKVKATAAKVSVDNAHECSVFTIWGEQSKKCHSLWACLMLDMLQFRNRWFEIESKLDTTKLTNIMAQ